VALIVSLKEVYLSAGGTDSLQGGVP